MIKATPITAILAEETQRISTGLPNLDKLFGGGIVTGSCIMFAGAPGAGKSTLWLQVSNNLAKRGYTVMYVTGEENLSQLRMRADRMNAVNEQLLVSDNIVLEDFLELIEKFKPKFIIADSLQMVYSKQIKSSIASPSQMKECLNKIIRVAKEKNIIFVAIGQSTKTGMMAGLNSLQHMVDVTVFLRVLDNGLRKLDVLKNRFGSAQTYWLAKMTKEGLVEMGNGVQFGDNYNETQKRHLNPFYWLIYGTCLLLFSPVLIPYYLIKGRNE